MAISPTTKTDIIEKLEALKNYDEALKAIHRAKADKNYYKLSKQEKHKLDELIMACLTTLFDINEKDSDLGLKNIIFTQEQAALDMLHYKPEDWMKIGNYENFTYDYSLKSDAYVVKTYIKNDNDLLLEGTKRDYQFTPISDFGLYEEFVDGVMTFYNIVREAINKLEIIEEFDRDEEIGEIS